MLKVAICIEQEPLREKYINYIRNLEKEHQSTVEIEVFKSGKQLLFEWASKENYADIIFIETDEIDELQIAHSLREQDVDASIVLLLKDVTKAVAAFDARVLRCIMIDEMDWSEQRHIIKTAIQKCEAKKHQHIVLKTRDETCKISLKDIQYFEMADHKITAYYQRRGEETQAFVFGGSIGQLAHLLGDKGFLNPNRSYLVAKAYIKELTKDKLILHNDSEISISKARRNEIKSEIAGRSPQ